MWIEIVFLSILGAAVGWLGQRSLKADKNGEPEMPDALKAVSIVLCAASGGFCGWKFGVTGLGISLCALMWLLTMAAAIDFRTLYVPDKLIIVGLIWGFLTVFFNPLITWYESLIGFLALGGGLALISLATKGMIGLADAKIFMVVGLVLGWKIGLFVLITSLILSGLVGMVLMIFKKKGRKSQMAFVSYIFISAAAVLFII